MPHNQPNGKAAATNHGLFALSPEEFRTEYNRLSDTGSWGTAMGFAGITATIASGAGLSSPMLAFALGALACGARYNHKAEEYWEHNWHPGL